MRAVEVGRGGKGGRGDRPGAGLGVRGDWGLGGEKRKGGGKSIPFSRTDESCCTDRSPTCVTPLDT